MFRPVMIAAALFLMATTAIPADAQQLPKQPAAQRWGQTENSQVSVSSDDPRTPRGENIEQFASEIYFDPRKLNDSSMILSMGFKPVDNPANPNKGDSEAEAQAKRLSGAFVSKRIKRVSDNKFEAEGDLMFGNRKIPTTVPFTASFDKNAAEPTIVFNGALNVPTAQVSTGQQTGLYPGQMPLNFNITAVPIKQ